MSNIVFIDPHAVSSEPFTTSDIVALYAGVQHHTVTRIIRNYAADFEEFGKLGFNIQPLPDSTTGQSEKLYRLNEDQATLLITYLKNTEQVRTFKKNLVRQFSAMKRHLLQWRIEREKSKVSHRRLTDAVRDNGGSVWTYKNLTDLAYKRVTGKSAAQLRTSRGASKKSAAKDFLAPDELAEVDRIDNLMTALLDTGVDYQGIKAILLQMDAIQTAS